jgi:hypothetical protein
VNCTLTLQSSIVTRLAQAAWEMSRQPEDNGSNDKLTGHDSHRCARAIIPLYALIILSTIGLFTCAYGFDYDASVIENPKVGWTPQGF